MLPHSAVNCSAASMVGRPQIIFNSSSPRQARFPFKRNPLRCVRCVNENRKKRKRLRWQAANHGCHCFDRAFLLTGACVCCVKFHATNASAVHTERDRVDARRVDETTFGLLASNVCIFIQLSITSLSVTSVSTGVVWRLSPIATRTYFGHLLLLEVQ